MMRTSSLVILLVTVAVGIGLFMVKYRVQDLEDQLVDLNREIARDRESIRVLRAEWSHLNEPARIRSLAGRYLGMEPVPVSNVASREEIDQQIPARPQKSDTEALGNDAPNSRKEKVP
jgi:cell division protein FtsL